MPARRERPAVVLGLDRTGLALVRALGRAGVPVHGISWRRDDVGRKSRYLTAGVAVKGGEANDDEALDALHRIAAGGRAVVFPAEDDWIELILRRWDEVRELA